MGFLATAGLLFAVGVIAGALNVLAGGGSLLTLPVLIFLGLPPTVANGTNRVAILVQNVAAVWGFQRHRLLDRAWIPLAALPAVAGAALGAWLAVLIDDTSFRRILAVLMVLIALWTVWNPLARRGGPRGSPAGGLSAARRIGLVAGFFLAGVYGGFIQAGVGFVLLGVITLAGLDLVRGNALKVLLVLAYTPISLAIFAAGGLVDWEIGIALALGNLVGALIGVRLAVLKGHAWIRNVVTVTVVVFALRLLFWG